MLRPLLKELVDKAFGTMLADESEAKPPLIVLMGHASARTISSRSCALGLLAAIGSGLRGQNSQGRPAGSFSE